MLYIAASIVGSLKTQRFATKQRHGFGFYFAQTARRRLVIRKISLVGMKDNVTKFVKKCLEWQLRKWVDCDLALAGLCGQVSYVALSFLPSSQQQTSESNAT